MKNAALIVLSLFALTATASAATKGEQVGKYSSPAAAARALAGGAGTARTMGKVGGDHAVAFDAAGRPAFVLLVSPRGSRSGRLSAAQAVDAAAPGRFATVTPGDGSGRGLPTLTATGLRVSADGRNFVVGARGGRFTVRRDAATATPATHQEIETAAYYRWLNGGNPDPTANWLAAEHQMRDGR